MKKNWKETSCTNLEQGKKMKNYVEFAHLKDGNFSRQ